MDYRINSLGTSLCSCPTLVPVARNNSLRIYPVGNACGNNGSNGWPLGWLSALLAVQDHRQGTENSGAWCEQHSTLLLRHCDSVA